MTGLWLAPPQRVWRRSGFWSAAAATLRFTLNDMRANGICSYCTAIVICTDWLRSLRATGLLPAAALVALSYRFAGELVGVAAVLGRVRGKELPRTSGARLGWLVSP